MLKYLFLKTERRIFFYTYIQIPRKTKEITLYSVSVVLQKGEKNEVR